MAEDELPSFVGKYFKSWLSSGFVSFAAIFFLYPNLPLNDLEEGLRRAWDWFKKEVFKVFGNNPVACKS